MKNNNIQDERVTAQKRKITSEAFLLVMTFLIGSILVKQFVYNASFSEYAIEFIAFFGASLYLTIRNIFVGNNLFPHDNQEKKKSIIVNSLVTGITITAVTAFLHFKELGNSGGLIITLVSAFVISTLVSFALYFCLNILNKRRIAKLENRFDDEIKKV